MTKIESIEVVPTTLPDMFGEQMHLCLVRVEAEGVVGWGEICDSYCCTFPEVYAPLVDHVYALLVLGSGWCPSMPSPASSGCGPDGGSATQAWPSRP